MGDTCLAFYVRTIQTKWQQEQADAVSVSMTLYCWHAWFPVLKMPCAHEDQLALLVHTMSSRQPVLTSSAICSEICIAKIQQYARRLLAHSHSVRVKENQQMFGPKALPPSALPCHPFVTLEAT
jgi:hypothetical protein